VPNFSGFETTDDNRDALALTLLSAVLDGYSGARLDRALAQGEGRLADSVGASNTMSGRGPQVFMLDAVPAKGKTPEQLEAALRAQIARIAKEGVSEAEMRRVKAQWMASNVYQRDSIFNQARELGNAWIEGMPLDSAERVLESLNTITPAQVQAVAAKYFGDDTLTVATLLPQTGARAFPRKPSAASRHGESTR